MKQFWTQRDIDAVNKAKTFKALTPVALKIISRSPQPLGQVCGPISTGGFGLMEKNLKVFRAAIQKLQRDGLNIFNQMLFQEPMLRIINRYFRAREHRVTLLDDFYLPIFRSGMMKRLYFLPNWETSFGARWEREQAFQLGILVVYLERDFIQKLNPYKPRQWP